MYRLQGFFSKIVLIVRIFSKIVRIFFFYVRICSKKCADCTDFFRKLYGFPLKMYGFLYGFFQKSFGHPAFERKSPNLIKFNQPQTNTFSVTSGGSLGTPPPHPSLIGLSKSITPRLFLGGFFYIKILNVKIY